MKQFNVIEISEPAIFLEWATQSLNFELRLHTEQRPALLKACSGYWQAAGMPKAVQDLTLEYYMPTGNWMLEYSATPVSRYPQTRASHLEINGSDDVVFYSSKVSLHMVWNWFSCWKPTLEAKLRNGQRQMLDVLSVILSKVACPYVFLGKTKDLLWGYVMKKNVQELIIELEAYRRRALTKRAPVADCSAADDCYAANVSCENCDNAIMVISDYLPSDLEFPYSYTPPSPAATVYFQDDAGFELRYV
jgi:hypothetical protein